MTAIELGRTVEQHSNHSDLLVLHIFRNIDVDDARKRAPIRLVVDFVAKHRAVANHPHAVNLVYYATQTNLATHLVRNVEVNDVAALVQ